MGGIGHNRGPALGPGHVYRTHMWRSAQRRLMPGAVPLLVVRMRVRRAAELGLDYRTYASIRQFSGQDILGLLFSSNALGILGSAGPAMPGARAAALRSVRSAQRLALVHAPLDPGAVAAANDMLEAAADAPRFTDSWSDTRARLERFIRGRRLPGSGILVIGDTPLEAEWCTAARAAGYLSAERYFTAPGG